MEPKTVAIVVLVSLVFLAILTLVTLLIIDKIIISRKIKKVHAGMTGLEIQKTTKKKLKIISVEGDHYYARLTSPLKFFKYNLVFKDARLKEIERI